MERFIRLKHNYFQQLALKVQLQLVRSSVDLLHTLSEVVVEEQRLHHHILHRDQRVEQLRILRKELQEVELRRILRKELEVGEQLLHSTDLVVQG